MGHALDRKACVGEVELASNELATDLRYQVLESCSEFRNDNLISQCEPTVFVRFWVSEIVRSLAQLLEVALQKLVLGGAAVDASDPHHRASRAHMHRARRRFDTVEGGDVRK